MSSAAKKFIAEIKGKYLIEKSDGLYLSKEYYKGENQKFKRDAKTKLFIDTIPNKYIPLQNVLIGLISAVICYLTKIETNLLQAIVLCLMATMGAGGIADLVKIKKVGEE